MESGVFGGGLIVGFILGMLFGAMAATWDTKNLINDCQLNLPRTQHCVLAAVPEQKEK